jgi:hypothetical protein
MPIGINGQNSVTKYPKYLKILIKQGVFLIVKISKKPPNQLARLGRQTLPYLPILHCEQ